MMIKRREGGQHAFGGHRRVAEGRLVTNLDQLEAVLFGRDWHVNNSRPQLLPGHFHLPGAPEVAGVQLGPALTDVEGQQNAEKNLADFESLLFGLDDVQELGKAPSRGGAMKEEEVVSIFGHRVDFNNLFHDPFHQSSGLARAIEFMNKLRNYFIKLH